MCYKGSGSIHHKKIHPESFLSHTSTTTTLCGNFSRMREMSPQIFIIPAHLVVHGLFSHHVILSRFPFHWDYVEMSETKFQISSPCIQIINNNNWFSLVLLPVPFLLVGMFIEDIKWMKDVWATNNFVSNVNKNGEIIANYFWKKEHFGTRLN